MYGSAPSDQQLRTHCADTDLFRTRYRDLQRRRTGKRDSKKCRSRGEYALIARAEKGSEDLIPPLTEKGMFVEDVPLYSTEYEVNPVLKDEAARMLRDREIDAVTFTSALHSPRICPGNGRHRDRLQQYLRGVHRRADSESGRRVRDADRDRRSGFYG